jgi:cob(I)alamin adenosyltransferase
MMTETQNIAGRILLFTGEGKGKTTAALGMVLRASGHGLRSLVIQFIKSDPATGELAGCKFLPGVEIIQAGLGFVPEERDPEFFRHREAAQRGLSLASDALLSGRYPLLVLDEICLAVSRKLLTEESVTKVIRKARAESCVVLTGRDAPAGLVSLADTMTEMRAVKHGFESGRKAQKGVEY